MTRHLIFTALVCSFVGAVFLAASAASATEAEKALVPHPRVEVIVRGSPIHGANGMYFDSKDHLFVASVIGRDITVLNRNTGKILARLGPEIGVEGPDDCTIGPDGSLYWTSILTGEVGRLTPEGELTTQYVEIGVNPITFTDTEPYRMFVALDFYGDALYEVDPELQEPPQLLLENLNHFNAFDFGPDGLLYGPLFFGNQIIRVDVDALTVETVTDGMVIPVAVKFDSQGNLYALDSYTGQVFIVDTETGEKEEVAVVRQGLDNLAFDSSDRLFVSSNNEGYVWEVTESGPVAIVEGGMCMASGVALMPNERGGLSAYVTNYFSLQEFDTETGEQLSIANYAWDPEGIITAEAVSPDGENLIISSMGEDAVQIWDPAAQEPVATYHEFLYPTNAIRFQGELIVCELGTGSVVQGTERIPLIEGLYVPTGLAATEEDIYVADWATGMVWKVGDADPVATGLSQPEGMAVDTDGNLLVIEEGKCCLSKIDLSTGTVSMVARGLRIGMEAIPGYQPFWALTGVAVAPDGDIYMTGDVTSTLYRIRR